MARVHLCVPDFPRYGSYSSGIGQGFVFGKNFDGDGAAFQARSQNTAGNAIFDFPIGPSADSGGTVFTYDSLYYFARFKVKRLPSAQTPLFNFYYRTAISIEFHFQLNTDGSISAYNDAGTANLVGTSAAVTLNSWVTIYGRLVGSRTTNNVGGASFFKDGVQIYNNFVAGTLPGAGVGLNGLAALPFYRVDCDLGIATNVGSEVDLDQLILDDTDPVTTASRFTRVFVTANGSFTQFASSAGTITNDWKYRNQRISQMVDSGISFPYCASTVNGEESSWRTQTLREAGITQGVKTAIIIHDTMNATNCRHFYTRNGGAQQYETSVTPSNPAEDWTWSLHDATSWGLDDTIEIGVRSGGGSSRCGFIGLWIEHTTPYVAETDGDVVFQRVNYTGTGSGAGGVGANEITLPFEPTFLMIAPRTGVSNTMHMWSRGHWFPHAFNDTPRRSAYVYKNKMILGGSDLNANGIVYDVFCIRDIPQRVIGTDNYYQVNQTVPFDTDNEQVNTTLAAPLAIWSWKESNDFADIQGFMMGPGQAADASIQFSPAAALTANVINALNATGFVYKRGRYTTANGGQYSDVTFKPANFNQTRLYDIFNYTGDGTANRVVPIVNFPASIPVWVIVFPHNNSGRYMRNNQQANALEMATIATNATAIAGFAAGQFTVNGTTNTNLIVYTAMVFFEGTDSASLNQYSGIYYIDPDARHETLWNRSGVPATENQKITPILVRTAFVGDR